MYAAARIKRREGQLKRTKHNFAHELQSVLRLTVGFSNMYCGKGKAVPLQAWSGPEGSRKLRFPN
jgi:hypothetical protein